MKPAWLILSVLLVVALAGCGSAASNQSAIRGKRGGTFVGLAAAAPSGSPDPQVNYTGDEWQLLALTHDGLVGFKRAGGAEGTKIVPDLAESIPKPTNGGKTYQFTLRKGITFSDGTELTPQDVKFTFERLFKIGDSPNAGTWYNVIQGGDACVKKPKSCSLSGITINGRNITFNLIRADPEFLDKLAMPFAFILPSGTPTKNVDVPPPGTGPYKWVQYAPNKQIKLVRNPYFKEWSAEAQPAGKPNVIVEKFGLSLEAQVTEVEHNQADWTALPPADRLSELGTKYPDRVHITPQTATYYFAMNVHEKPFDNLKARQAVNFATDRNALVKIVGGPRLAAPTCQVLPPNFPGYRPYCPYTKNPGSGKWTAPDMAKAQQLVDQSGTKGAAVKVTTDTTETDKALGVYFVSLLNKLGYKASLQALSSDIEYPYIQNSKNHVQFAFTNWYPDYPAASDFLKTLLGCGSIHPNSNASPNISQFCDRGNQNQMDAAGTKSITDPTAGNAMWAKVDQAVTDQAPWVAMYNPKWIDVLSSRVRGYTFSPQWTMLFDQSSVG